MTKRSVFTLFFFLLLPVLAFAQTNAEKLEQAVRIYNALRDYEDNLRPGKVSEENITYMKAEIAKAKPMLDDVVSNGTADEANAARYFRANFQYELGFVYGMMGRNQDAYDVLTPIKNDYESFSQPSAFPLRYVFDGKNYAVKYENFAPTLAEYYTGMAEITANLSKTQESLQWGRKAYSFSYTTDWYKYIAANKIIEQKKKIEEWDTEFLDLSLAQLNLYNALDTSYKRTIRENNYPSHRSSYKNINTALEKHPELGRNGYYYAQAAPGFVKAGDDAKASEYYHKAFDSGYGGASFADEAIAHARKTDDDRLGKKACAEKEKWMGSSDCSGWRTLASAWDEFGDKTKADAARAKAKACEEQAEKIRRRQQKEQNRRDRNMHAYFGIYPGPLIIRYGHYRDYGGIVGFGIRGFCVEASYKIINENYVFYEDLSLKSVDTDGFESYWDGYRASLAFKFHPHNADEGFYVGPLFETVSRSYRQTQSQIFNAADGSYAGYKSFSPSEKSYNLFLNYGMQQEKKHFLIDLFFGLGAAYHQFDAGIPEYGDPAYTFDNVVLQHRKPERFGFVVRGGFILGLTTKK